MFHFNTGERFNDSQQILFKKGVIEGVKVSLRERKMEGQEWGWEREERKRKRGGERFC